MEIKSRYVPIYNPETMPKKNNGYTFFKVDGSALFQSARIDGADFLNFDTRKGVTSIPVIFVGRAIYARKCFRVARNVRTLMSTLEKKNNYLIGRVPSKYQIMTIGGVPPN